MFLIELVSLTIKNTSFKFTCFYMSVHFLPFHLIKTVNGVQSAFYVTDCSNPFRFITWCVKGTT